MIREFNKIHAPYPRATLLWCNTHGIVVELLPNGGCFLLDGAPLARHCQSVSSRGAAAICDYVTGFLRKLQASKTREGVGMALSSYGCGIDLVSSAEEK